MTDAHLDTKLLVDMLCQMLGGIHTAMLTTRTTEREHQRGKATLDIPSHMGIGEFIHRIEEGEDLTVVLQESDNGLIETRQFLIGFIAARIVCRTTIEHITATITTLVLGNSLAVREAEHLNHQRTLRVSGVEWKRTS